MRYLAGLVLALALGVMGCSDTEGAGGSAGDGGSGGGGSGGTDLCEGVICEDDSNECTEDGVCDPTDGMCDYAAVGDGTECGQGPGACEQGVCVGGVFACTEEGIRNAIDVGGGPHTFDCDGPTTITTDSEFSVEKSVILDGEGNITLDGTLSVGVTWMAGDQSGVEVAAGVRGFDLPRGVIVWGSSLDLEDCSAGASVSIDGIERRADVAIRNCNIEGEFGLDRLEGLFSLTLTNTTVEGPVIGAIQGRTSGDSSITLVSSVATTVTADFGMTLTLIDSTVSGGEGVNGCGTLIAVNSAITNNDGGFNLGPGGIDWRGALSLTNTTVSGNQGDTPDGQTGWGGRSYAGGLEFEYDPLCAPVEVAEIHNSTFANNDPSAIETDTQLDIRGSVVGDCSGPVISLGYNIESPGNTCGFDQQTDQVNVTAVQLNLGPLQDNGGPTMTHALLPGSVAIDAIPAEDCVDADGAALTTDQRGEPRPETGGTMCDVGAFEVQP